MTTNSTLSVRQTEMLRRLARVVSEESPFGYGRNSGRIASAWHRTAYSLKERGLATITRCGDHFQAQITAFGQKLLNGTAVLGRSKSDAAEGQS